MRDTITIETKNKEEIKMKYLKLVEELDQFIEMLENDLDNAKGNGDEYVTKMLENYIKDLKEIIEE